MSDSTSRAIWFTHPRRAELQAEPVPSPGSGDIIVRAIASLISSGTEMNVYRGESVPEANLPTTGGQFPFPIKYAYQIVGVVEHSGADSGYTAGEKVFAQHPHQERFRIATGARKDRSDGASLVHPVPPGLDAERAVFANLFSVAYTALLDVPVRIGDVAVVSGLGVIGTFAAYLARRTAGRLILVDPLPQRRERAGWIGAEAVVHPDDLVNTVNALSEERGADVFIEASGSPAALQGALMSTGKEGSIVAVSFYGNRPATLLLSPEFHLRRQRIVSSFVGQVGSGLQPRWTARRRMAVAMEELGRFDIERLVTHRVTLEDAPHMYREIDEHPESSLAVVINYGQD